MRFQKLFLGQGRSQGSRNGWSKNLRWFAMSAVVVYAAAFLACGTGTGMDAGMEPTTFSTIQADIFDVSCSSASCHDGDGPANGLDLTDGNAYGNLVDVDASYGGGDKRVIAGDPDNSLLYKAVNEGFSDQNIRQMPPGSALSDEKIAAIKSWIEAGAENN